MEETMKPEKVNDLILEALETELGGVQIYEAAVKNAINPELQEEWQKYLEQTERHVQILKDVCQKLNIDTDQETPGRKVTRHIGESLVFAINLAAKSAEPEGAQVVAAECVVLAETKDHSNWELIGLVAEKSKGEQQKILKQAHDQVENEEDEHLYHTMGWARELQIKGLGLPAVIPPPEEEKDVKTAIGAARAKSSRKDLL
jgi:hypothetical protein